MGDDDRDAPAETIRELQLIFTGWRNVIRRDLDALHGDQEKLARSYAELLKTQGDTMKAVEELNRHLVELKLAEQTKKEVDAAPLKWLQKIREWGSVLLGIAMLATMLWSLATRSESKKVEKMEQTTEKLGEIAK